MRKRWLISGLLVAGLAAAYTGYWFWLARTFERNLALWVEQQRALGYQISYSAGEASGYPLAATIRLDDVSVVAPPSQQVWSVTTDAVQVSISPWSPLHLRLAHPRQRAVYELQLAEGTAKRKFQFSVALGTASLSLTGDGGASALAVDALTLEVLEATRKIAFIHDLHGGVDLLPPESSLAQSASFRATLSVATLQALAESPLGDQIAGLQLTGRVVGPISTGPAEKALTIWSDAGGTVELTEVNATWGPIAASANGTLALDRQLQPIGAFTVIARGFNKAIDAAVEDQLMTPHQGTAAKVWLNARAEKDEVGPKVKLPLTIQDGFVSMGPVQLAQVPRIEWQ